MHRDKMKTQPHSCVFVLCVSVIAIKQILALETLPPSHAKELEITENQNSKNSTGGKDPVGEASRNVFSPASAPINVSVAAVVSSAQRRLLQLRIAWAVPSGGRRPESYNVHVEPDKRNHPGCLTDPYYSFIPDKDATEWRVPVDVGGAVPHENLHILPGCRYRVSLEANPHDGRTSAVLLYTVPECVERVCTCFHAAALPQPLVRVSHSDENTVNISWRLIGPSVVAFNVTAFLLGVGKEMMRSSGQKTVYNTSWMKEIPAKLTKGAYHVIHEVPGPGNYMASVKVVDDRHCWGAPGNYTFTVSENNELAVTGFTKSEVMWMTVLPSVSVALAMCVALSKVCQRCFLWAHRRLHPRPPHWTGIYKPISLDRTNILYVPSEARLQPEFQESDGFHQQLNPGGLFLNQEARQKGEADGYEVSYSRLALGRQIGKGAFGRVFLARAEAIAGIPGNSIVAVKKLKHKATVDEVEEFLSEISMMKKVGRHPNIVTMVGCCTLTHPYCMIMEYVPCGDLLAYLRQLRNQHDRYRQLQPLSIGSRYSLSSDGSYITPLPAPSCASSAQPSTRCSAMSSIAVDGVALEVVLDPRELHSFATQIARGMTFLESKQITHRDLAARNLLIDERKTLKISDFGLSRSGIYVNTKRRKVPLRWLSVEAMRDSLYSSKSDVWAFGVVLWEIGTLGGFPYPTVSDHELLEFLLSGKRLEKPDNISDELYSLMEVCWSQSADDRPSFKEILFQLDSSPRKSVYVDFHPNQQLPPTEQISAPVTAASTVI